MKTTTSLGIRKGAWTAEEDKLLKGCVEKHGEGKWHQVPLRAGRLPGRTANDIKNYWNTHLHKKTTTTSSSSSLSKQAKEKTDDHKIIVKTKVIRPLPRIFKGNLSLSPLLFHNPGIANNDINSAHHVQAPCNSSMIMELREKVEDEVMWWENLLSDDGTINFPIIDGTEDIGPINLWTQDIHESLTKVVDENYVENGFAFDASFLGSFD
ncbi:hypothetical protein ACFE04_009418 [Oxalis oulophora]